MQTSTEPDAETLLKQAIEEKEKELEEKYQALIEQEAKKLREEEGKDEEFQTRGIPVC
jgi:hypothetical protein